MNIGETFLYDPEDCQFHIGGEAPKQCWNIKARINFAALSESCNVALEGGNESRLIQEGRVKQVRNRANLFSDLFNQNRIFRDALCGMGVQVLRLGLQRKI